MPQITDPLPAFDNPPVVETVMGLHFRPPSGFHVASRAQFLSGFRDAFPVLEERVPVDEVRESFDAKVIPSLKWSLSDGPPSPRLWARSQSGWFTLQVQQDAFLANWERSQTERKYWSYVNGRRPDFLEKLTRLEEHFREWDLGSIQPTSWAMTYINHIPMLDGESFGQVLARVLCAWNNAISEPWLPEPEQGAVRLAYKLPDQKGRLHLNAAPAIVLKDERTVLRLDLTARGSVKAKGSVLDAMTGLDLGHEWIVRGFTALTTLAMHEEWKRSK